ncbi:MAG TPA: hypothetical protein VF306_09760 [Pirellulales bacterium]
MLTVRLPDLTLPTAPRRGRLQPGIDSADAVASVPVGSSDPRPLEMEEPAPRGILARIYQFIMQPKFWLACITAVVVQVVLALVFTPPPPAADPAPGRRKASVASDRAPPSRIVVPPAESSSAQGAAPATDLLTAPQMQPAPPADAAMQIEPLPATPAAPLEGTEAASGHPQGARVAEQRRLAEQRRYDGQPAAEAFGATLEGVSPIDDAELHQTQSGNR